jgi:quercetin dioxygenase-like cupin family protein
MPMTTSEEIRIGSDVIRFLVDPETTGGSASLFEFDIPSDGAVPPPHSHDAFDETIYGLRGTLTWAIAGETVAIGPGDVVHIPRGVVHSFQNLGTELATGLAIATPGLLGPAYFRDIAGIINVEGPPDFAAALEVMRRHGLTPAAP